SLKGFVKNSTAPAFIACTVIGTSPYPVMKMIGMSSRSTTRCCTSSPLRSGSDTSRTRQLGAQTRGRARNAAAEAKGSTCQPAQRISPSSASRTETSSSTTNTMGVLYDMGDALLACMALPLDHARGARSAPAQGGLERLQQRRLAERLEQARHGPLGEQAGPVGLIAVRGDEDDRNRVSAPRQFLLELESGHARHGDVEEETLGLAKTRGHEEGFCRRKRLDRKAALPQQVGERLAHGLVVIDDRHQDTVAPHGLLLTGAASVTAGRPVAAGLSGPAPPPPPPRTTKANATPAP